MRGLNLCRGKLLGAAAGALLGMLTVVVSIGCSGPNTTQAKNPAPDSGAAGGTLTVAVAPAKNLAVEASVQVTGSFVAKETSDVAPEAGGRITETPVDVGDFVQQGQVIARLEDRDAKLRLDQAAANEQQAEAGLRQAQSRIGLGQGAQFNPDNVPEVLSAKANADSAAAQARLAEADAQRYANLLKTGDVSQSAYEKFRTQADTAEAQSNAARQQYEATLNNARQNFQGTLSAEASLSGVRSQGAMARKAVDDTVVRAPFAGYISARPIAAGQYVGVNSKIATLLRITPIRLELQVPEVNAPDMKLSVAVEAMVPGYPGRIFQGRVTAINPAVDPSSRTFTSIAEFPNADIALKPGMFGTARILLPGSSMGLFVPRAAVITDPTTNSSQLYFVRDDRARVAVVQLGATRRDMVQILSGISPGALIATDHLSDLFDGMVVKTTPAATGSGSPEPASGATKSGLRTAGQAAPAAGGVAAGGVPSAGVPPARIPAGGVPPALPAAGRKER